MVRPKQQREALVSTVVFKIECAFEDFEKNNIKIITFNYDRSLEYFLLKSMKSKYSGQDENAILKKLQTIPIIHVYGKLGNLPVYDSPDSLVPYDLLRKAKIERSGNFLCDYLYRASSKIITIYQAKEIEPVLGKARDFILDAQRIYFLGFGFDTINMQRLFCVSRHESLKRSQSWDKMLWNCSGLVSAS